MLCNNVIKPHIPKTTNNALASYWLVLVWFRVVLILLTSILSNHRNTKDKKILNTNKLNILKFRKTFNTRWFQEKNKFVAIKLRGLLAFGQINKCISLFNIKAWMYNIFAEYNKAITGKRIINKYQTNKNYRRKYEVLSTKKIFIWTKLLPLIRKNKMH